jgi:hypothetical protein
MNHQSVSTRVPEQVLILEPSRSEKNYWADLWRYRELFPTLHATIARQPKMNFRLS